MNLPWGNFTENQHRVCGEKKSRQPKPPRGIPRSIDLEVNASAQFDLSGCVQEVAVVHTGDAAKQGRAGCRIGVEVEAGRSSRAGTAAGGDDVPGLVHAHDVL